MNPVAAARATIVKGGKARFTVLTSRLIRLEWSEGGKFIDAASFTFVNRLLPVPKFTQKQEGEWFKLKTDDVELQYKVGEPFTHDSLSITLTTGDRKGTKWVPGLVDPKNLFGTARTLDFLDGSLVLDPSKDTGHEEPCHFALPTDDTEPEVKKPSKKKQKKEAAPAKAAAAPAAPKGDNLDFFAKPKLDSMNRSPSLFSPSGWSVIDDSVRPLFDESADCPWVAERPKDGSSMDLYFFGYGLAFRDALRDYTRVAGRMGLPPRFTLGVWFSRYWAFGEQEYKDLVNEHRMHNIPLDVLVVDMDWHQTFYKQAGAGVKDQSGQDIGWSGHTWDANLFPNPKEFFEWTKRQGLRTTLNLHPASGIQPNEETYPAMAKAMGIDPATKKFVKCDLQGQKFMRNYFDIVLNPLRDLGVDFWWLDWQQGETWEGMSEGVHPTFWLNHVFAHKSRLPHLRPLIFHRWGGLGNHRYQIGFSGDVVTSWKSLKFQPDFTATAANVAFGYWSHDIGGHINPSPPELYTRWIQWGIFSPIFRTHCTKSPENDRRVWEYPSYYFQIMRTAIHLRAAMVPYIYSAARAAHESGVAIVRHMYVDYPAEDEAYTFPEQFMFGDDLLVSPVTDACDPATGLAKKTVWLPRGDWVDFFTGHRYTGPQTLTRNYTLEEMPVFAKAGAIIPLAQLPDQRSHLSGLADRICTNFSLLTFLPSRGTTRTETTWSDDDGDSAEFLGDQHSVSTTASVRLSDDQGKVFVHVAPQKGSFAGQPTERTFEIRLRGSWPALSVRANGKDVPYAADNAVKPSWCYDGRSLTLVVALSATAVGVAVDVEVALQRPKGSRSASATLADVDVVAAMGRAYCVQKMLDDNFPTALQEDYTSLLRASAAAQIMTAKPSSTPAEIASFASKFAAARSEVEALKKIDVQNKCVAYLS